MKRILPTMIARAVLFRSAQASSGTYRARTGDSRRLRTKLRLARGPRSVDASTKRSNSGNQFRRPPDQPSNRKGCARRSVPPPVSAGRVCAKDDSVAGRTLHRAGAATAAWIGMPILWGSGQHSLQTRCCAPPFGGHLRHRLPALRRWVGATCRSRISPARGDRTGLCSRMTSRKTSKANNAKRRGLERRRIRS